NTEARASHATDVSGPDVPDGGDRAITSNLPDRGDRPTGEARSARRRNLVVSLAVLTAFVLALLGAAMSPLLDIEEIHVVGAGSAAHEAAIRRASGLDVGESIVTFLPGSAAGKVDDLPWVATAHVSRHLPHVVRITVTERTPVAWVRAGSGAF